MSGQPADSRGVEKSRRNRCPGRVVRIDLGDGTCAYGRQLLGVRVEFYDRVSQPGQTVDLLDVVRGSVAFTVAVMDQAFRRGGRWELLDVVTLSGEERTAVYRRAKIDLISGRLTVYWEDPAAGTWGETPATLEECLVLEPSAVWGAEQVEDRLRDHFAHRPNRWLESLRQPFLDAAT
ncbi:Imm26 family immunity protein [Amycolatopsis lurida]